MPGTRSSTRVVFTSSPIVSGRQTCGVHGGRASPPPSPRSPRRGLAHRLPQRFECRPRPHDPLRDGTRRPRRRHPPLRPPQPTPPRTSTFGAGSTRATPPPQATQPSRERLVPSSSVDRGPCATPTRGFGPSIGVDLDSRDMASGVGITGVELDGVDA